VKKSGGYLLFRRVALHAFRVVMFVAVVLLIRLQHQRAMESATRIGLENLSRDDVAGLFPGVQTLRPSSNTAQKWSVFDARGSELGYILSTSPACDHVIGFSGPTTTLIALDLDDRISGLSILTSDDTDDHVAHVRNSQVFMTAFNGMTGAEVANIRRVDAVSGATLTSSAIATSVIHRMGGKTRSLLFPQPITITDVQKLFPSANRIEPKESTESVWRVYSNSSAGKGPIGHVVRTTPVADKVIGYQGPTDALIGIDHQASVKGIVVLRSFDNQPYVRYTSEDTNFLNILNGRTLEQLAIASLEELEVEGVAGATMTSQAVAQGVLVTAFEIQNSKGKQHWQDDSTSGLHSWRARDFGTAIVILWGLVLAFTHLRRKKSLRVIFQIGLIIYLGLINGDLISQAMLIGWAHHGVPWQRAGGLVLLTVTALLIPIFTKRNVYCTHLCPHGAIQQLAKKRLSDNYRFSPKTNRVLRCLPYLLLFWCVLVAMLALPFSLVDIEPFDAWVWHVAGWPSIVVAIVGLLASLFEPMAYCRFGCPTGALLGYLRNASNPGWTARDWIAVSLLAVAVGAFLIQ
jgi:NosR/NirI family nitrous oxide reductase transcriptional regulator